MHILFVVNDILNINASNTRWLIHSAAQRGWLTRVADVTSFSAQPNGQVVCRAVTMPVTDQDKRAVQQLLAQQTEDVYAVAEFDVVMIRTNPARAHNPLAHESALDLLLLAADNGTPMFNHPRGLRLARNKLYLMRFPESVRPTTLVSRNSAEIIAYVQTLGESAVLKPIQGTRGQDVFFVRTPNDPNLRQIVDVLIRQGAVMVQNFLPGAPKGDTRILVCNGELLEVDGKVASIHRVPGKGELRSNIHIGGHSIVPTISAEMRNIVREIGPILRRDGLFLVGLDIIDNRIIEVNSYSPGGFDGSLEFTGVDFAEVVLNKLAAML